MTGSEGRQAFEYSGHEELEQQAAMPRYNQHIARLFLRKIQPGKSQTMDFGAGIGTISALVRQQGEPAGLCCLEIDPRNTRYLKEQGFSVVDDLRCVADESLDVVFSSNVLEHIADHGATVARLYSKLKPGGYAIFWVPAFPCLWSAMDSRVAHCRRYRKANLKQVFEENGFRTRACFYQDSLGFFVALLFRLVGGSDGRVSTRSVKFYDAVIFPLSRLCDSFCAPLFGKNVIIYAQK